MNEYEQQVLQLWRQADRRPVTLATRVTGALTGRVRSPLHTAGQNPDRTLGQLLERMRDAARESIIRTLEHSSTASQMARVERILRQSGSHAQSAQDIRMLPLQIKDHVARQLARENTLTVAAEGALAGLAASLCELIPGLQALALPAILADMAASVWLLAQNAVRIGYSYGYSIDEPEDIAHFLIAMAPYTADAALLESKWVAHTALRQSGAQLAATFSGHGSIATLAAANPAIGSLIDRVAARLALRLGEREWGLLVPVAGAVIQGSVNAAFARAGSAQAMRYFQHVHLLERYGEEYLQRQWDPITHQQIG